MTGLLQQNTDPALHTITVPMNRDVPVMTWDPLGDNWVAAAEHQSSFVQSLYRRIAVLVGPY